MEMVGEPPKRPFPDVWHASGFGYDEIQTVASRSQVGRVVVDAMLFGNRPVTRDQAMRVLEVLSKRAQRTDWTLDTVDVKIEEDSHRG